MPIHTSDYWKERYRDSVAELEAKEQEWREAERLLRQSLSRLSLAVETSDLRLTRQLESLRQAIGEDASSSQIKDLIAQISATVMRLDAQTDGSKEVEGFVSRIEAALARQTVPAALKKATRDLKRHLREARRGHHLARALDAYTDYVGAAVEYLTALEEDRREEGLLGRLFGRAEDSDSDADAEATGTQAEALTSAADVPALRDDLPSFQSVLLNLLDQLDLSGPLANEKAEIVTLLQQPPSADLAEEAVDSIADLVQHARQEAELARQEIESFLAQLTDRLEALDRYLDDSAGRLAETSEQGELIHESVSTSVNEIRQSMSAVQDLEQLKREIQSHLSHILQRMDLRRHLEHKQLREAEAQVQQLKQELARVQEESQHLRERLSEASELALHDGLTGLKNRLAYEERIAQECARWERYRRPAVLTIWDIDFFKRINDRLGHSAGDKVLKIIGSLIKSSTRKADFAARFGGEEFVLLLAETEIDDALHVADKLRATIASSRFQYRGEPVPVTISCGLTEFLPGDTPETVYRRADQALYEAKRAGRNCCRVYGRSTE